MVRAATNEPRGAASPTVPPITSVVVVIMAYPWARSLCLIAGHAAQQHGR
jgi:hypothetical protein